MRILITGADGLLGKDLTKEARRLGHDVVSGVRSQGSTLAISECSLELDVTDPESVHRTVRDVEPDAVVHCAAYTDVDSAEVEPRTAMAVNLNGTCNVALAASRCRSLFFYLSSDYIFDGQSSRPYTPDDPPNPINVYGQSKMAGEEAVREISDRWLIVRTSWLYGEGAPNFVTRIRQKAQTSNTVRVVDDQIGRPTWTVSLSKGLLELLEMRICGRVLHLADRGEASWYELAREVCRLEGITTRVIPVSTREWDAPARRPRYSVLDLTQGEDCLGRPMADWRESLRCFFEKRSRDLPVD